MFDAVMVMGVSGCGKSTVGDIIAHQNGGKFLDGDDYHPPSNIHWMASGKPLTDEMRWPWLDAIAQAVQDCLFGGAVRFRCEAYVAAHRSFHAVVSSDQPIRHAGAARRRVRAYLDGPAARRDR